MKKLLFFSTLFLVIINTNYAMEQFEYPEGYNERDCALERKQLKVAIQLLGDLKSTFNICNPGNERELMKELSRKTIMEKKRALVWNRDGSKPVGATVKAARNN